MAEEEASIYDKARESTSWLQQQLPQEIQRPTSGIICGSGLGGLADLVVAGSKVEIPYGRIPHFAQSTGMMSSQRVGQKAIPAEIRNS